ncbi:MAG: hypothetical protein EOO01_27455 [Chitinophagaceae bacterium]|nr:MAG: hypothetical protein EOO01_27455 [Chitinophagaceae bacterium]
MALKKLELSELEKDIIKELVNIGLARAADSFAIISKERVLLSVPDLRLIDANQIIEMMDMYKNTHVFIQSDIKGDFNGATLMLFSAGHIDRLTEVCLGGIKNLGSSPRKMQESLLLEISNIITGALVTQLANILKCNIYGSPPKLPEDQIAESLKDLLTVHPMFQPVVVTVLTQFTDSLRQVDLPLFLFFDAETIIKILEIIRAANKTESPIFKL